LGRWGSLRACAHQGRVPGVVEWVACQVRCLVLRRELFSRLPHSPCLTSHAPTKGADAWTARMRQIAEGKRLGRAGFGGLMRRDLV
jgi:hypothetical protein